MKRRIIVAAVGGDRQLTNPDDFGRAVANAECILLTGGRGDQTDHTKDRAIIGARSATADGAVPRLIGILRSDPPPVWCCDKHSLFLHTGLSSASRNVINGVTPDVVAVFGGSKGTLAEMAFAAAAGKRVIFCGTPKIDVVKRLLQRYERYFASPKPGEDATGEFLQQPLAKFPHAWPSGPPSVNDLKTCMQNLLSRASELLMTPADAARACCNITFTSAPTGFPGLPGDQASKQRFEEKVQRISR